MSQFSRLLLAGAAGLLAGLLLTWAPTSAQEPAGRGKGPTYQLLLANAGNGAELLRYRSDSGEAWMTKNLTWHKIIEADNLPPGDYEVQMVGLPAVNGADVTRIERGSGRAWVMRNMKWIEVGESK